LIHSSVKSDIDRREFLKKAALSSAGLALAGCSGGEVSTGKRINYWHHFTSQTEMKGLQQVTAMFAAQYPEIDLVQENIPNKDFMAKYTAAVQARTPPNTTMVTSDRLGNMVAMGGLVDLTERVESWDLKKHFPPDRWDGVSVDGVIYGVPAFAFVDWVYYRKDWFEEAGIDGPPTTMEEFQEAAIKLTDPSKGRYGFGMRAGDGGHGLIFDMIESFGSPILIDGKPAIDAAKAAEALRFYSELYTVHKVVPKSALNDSYRQIMEAFRTGQTAMVFHGTGSLTELQGAMKESQFMVALKPAGPAALVTRLGYLYNGLMKEDDAGAGWDWVSYWGNPDPTIRFMETTGYFPSSAQVAADPRVTGNPYFAVAIAAVKLGRLPLQFVGAEAWGRHTVLPAFQEILMGVSTPEQAVEKMIIGLDKILS
jgi:multiple sugar transport system substrate-binding protein